MSEPMLKRIINPDGTTDFNIDRLKQQYTNKYVNNVFTNEVFLKYFYETLQNEDEIPFSSKIGRIMQQTTQPGEANRYAFFFLLKQKVIMNLFYLILLYLLMKI